MRLNTYNGLLFASVVWGTLTFGAVYPWAYWPLAVMCAALGVMGLRFGRGRISGLGACLVAVAVGALLQLLPLSRPILLTVSPATDALLRQYQLGYSLNPPAWHPLSIAPASTWTGIALLVAFGLLLLGSSRAMARIDLERLVRRVMVFGLLLAVFGIVQKAFHGENPDRLIYGFWRPLGGRGNPFGPFVNRNHFAGWMLLALPLALGYGFALMERGRQHCNGWRDWIRWMAGPENSALSVATFSVLVMGTALVLTGSRSGIASLAWTIVVAGAFVMRALRRRSTGLLVVAYALMLLFAAVAWAGVDRTMGRFAQTSDEDLAGRLNAWRDTARIVHDFPAFGTGLNTYGTAMLVYQTGDRTRMYREAHNDYLQLVAEGGLLLTVPIALAIGLLVRDIRRRFREGADPPMTRWIRIGAVASLAGIAAQSLVDFSLQMPGNAVLFSLVAAIAIHTPGRPHRASGV